MRESELHAHIQTRSADLTRAFPRVLLGPGDDCALVRSSGDLLLTVDQLIEGRHFVPGTPPDAIARKIIARSISDIAAMAGTPVWALATGAIPEGYAHADELFDAMARWGRRWGAPLVGGDLASVPAGTPLMLTCTVGGEPHPARGAVLRSGARVGDGVYVTGQLGGSFEHEDAAGGVGRGGGRHLTFEPRLDEARTLAGVLGDRLHAMIDISDGLGRDAGRIAAASGVRIELDGASIPVHPGSDLRGALSDGEDYELVFTVASGAHAAIPALPCGVTRIGRVAPGHGCIVAGVDGTMKDVAQMGWDH